jgi:hypothetical protein
MAQAKQARRIKLEGQEEGDPEQDKMGVYELEEGKEVNTREVWKATGKEVFMYYASNNEWFIYDREHMEAGEGAGWMSVASTALTPDKITETWRVEASGAFVDSPKVRARVCTAEEARAEAERLEQQGQRAMAQAKQGRRIKLEGQEEGDPQQDKMGVYELEEGKEVNARGVRKRKGGGEEAFMYYNGSVAWLVGDREDMEAGRNMAWLCCISGALTPCALPQGWRVVPGKAKGSCTEKAPKVRARLA